MGFQATFAGRKIASLDLNKYTPLVKLVGKTLAFAAIAIGAVWFVISAFIGFTNQPQKVRVTNVTGSSATISWITSNRDAGQVIVSDDSKFAIWPFSLISRENKFYDDRDVALAQEKSLAKWITKASKDVDATFSITGANAEEVYDYKVKKQDNYYVHHVTVFDLNESSNYEFKVGNGWRFWSYNSVNQELSENDAPVATSFEFSTYNHPTSIPAPSPAYGKVFGMIKVDGQFLTEDESKDSVVYYRLLKEDGSQSNILSSVTNQNGGWTVDRSNWRDAEGALVRFSPNVDAAELWFNYQDVDPRERRVLLLGVDDEPADGLLGNYEDTAKSNENLIMKASRFIRVGIDGYVEDMAELLSGGAIVNEYLASSAEAATPKDCDYVWFRARYPELCKDDDGDNDVPGQLPDDKKKDCDCCDEKVKGVPETTNCEYVCKTKGGIYNNKCPKDDPPPPPPPEKVEKCVGGLLAYGCYTKKDGEIIPPTCYCKSSTTGKNINCKNNPDVEGCGNNCVPAGCGSDENAPGLKNTYIGDDGKPKLCPAKKEDCSGNARCTNGCFGPTTKGSCCNKATQYEWISAVGGNCDTYIAGGGWTYIPSITTSGSCVAPTNKVGTCCKSIDLRRVEWKSDSAYSCFGDKPAKTNTLEKDCQPTVDQTVGTCCRKTLGAGQNWYSDSDLNCVDKHSRGWSGTKTTANSCPTVSDFIIDECKGHPGRLCDNAGMWWQKKCLGSYILNDDGSECIPTRLTCLDGADPILEIKLDDDGFKSGEFRCPNICCGYFENVTTPTYEWTTDRHCKNLEGSPTHSRKVDSGYCGNNEDGTKITQKGVCYKKSNGKYEWDGSILVQPDSTTFVSREKNDCDIKNNEYKCCQLGDKYYWEPIGECSGKISTLDEKSCIAENKSMLGSVCCYSESEGGYYKGTNGCKNTTHRLSADEFIPFEACPVGIKRGSSVLFTPQKITLKSLLIPNVSAADTALIKKDPTNSNIYYFTNSGSYNIKYMGNDYNIYAQANSPTLLYVEKNNIEGYQAGEDLVIDSVVEEIEIKQLSSVNEIKLQAGPNMVSFPYLPSIDGKNSLMASSLISIANNGHKFIQSITYFENGAWDGGLVAPAEGETVPSGRDFPLQFGKGYLIVANYDTTVEVPGFDILDPIPLAFKSGWNLVGIHGYNTPYTAHSFANSITALGTITADNITKWDTAKGRYEGIQVSQDTLYGFDYPIQQDLGYFVRISEFKPTSPDSLSIIWSPGSDKHGTEAK